MPWIANQQCLNGEEMYEWIAYEIKNLPLLNDKLFEQSIHGYMKGLGAVP